MGYHMCKGWHTNICVLVLVYTRDGQLLNYHDNCDYFIGNNRHCVLFVD